MYRISMIIEKAASQLEALGNSSRLKIYRVLVRAGEKGIPVGQLQERVGIPSSTLSHHLKELTAAGLVTTERSSRHIIYRAAYAHMNALLGYLTDNCCAGAPCAVEPAAACGC